MIHWTPISEMPDELRDGRDVLVLTKPFVGMGLKPIAMVVDWCDTAWMTAGGSIWYDADITHYSEINEPEGVR